MDETGERRIRSLKMRSGRAVFRLVSEANPKVVTVSVLSRSPLVSAADIASSSCSRIGDSENYENVVLRADGRLRPMHLWRKKIQG